MALDIFNYDLSELQSLAGLQQPEPRMPEPTPSPVFDEGSFPQEQAAPSPTEGILNIKQFTDAIGAGSPDLVIGPYVNQYLPRELLSKGYNTQQIGVITKSFLDAYYGGPVPKQIGAPTPPVSDEGRMGDLPLAFAKGGVGVAQNAVELADFLRRANPLTAVQDYVAPEASRMQSEFMQSMRNVLNEQRDRLQELVSPKGKEISANLEQAGKQDIWGQIKDTVKIIKDSPSVVPETMLQSVPAMATLLPFGKLGRLAVGGAEGVQAYFDGVSQAIEKLEKASPQEIEAAYKRNFPDGTESTLDNKKAELLGLMKQGLAPIVLTTGLTSAALGGMETSLFKEQAKDIVDKVVLKRISNTVGKAVKGGVEEFIEEGTQGPFEALWGNVAERVLKPDTPLTEGVGSQGVLGAISGLGFGTSIGGAHGITRPVVSKNAPTPQNDTEKKIVENVPLPDFLGKTIDEIEKEQGLVPKGLTPEEEVKVKEGDITPDIAQKIIEAGREKIAEAIPNPPSVINGEPNSTGTIPTAPNVTTTPTTETNTPRTTAEAPIPLSTQEPIAAGRGTTIGEGSEVRPVPGSTSIVGRGIESGVGEPVQRPGSDGTNTSGNAEVLNKKDVQQLLRDAYNYGNVLSTQPNTAAKAQELKDLTAQITALETLAAKDVYTAEDKTVFDKINQNYESVGRDRSFISRYNNGKEVRDSLGDNAIPRTFVRSELDNLVKAFDNGKLDADGLATKLENLSTKLTQRADAREGLKNPRVRGELFFREKLLNALRRGFISKEQHDLASWLVDKNPALVSKLGISIGKNNTSGRTAGFYNVLNRIIRIVKNNPNPDVVVHEVLHHTERMMPVELQQKIVELWKKELLTTIDQAAKANDVSKVDQLMTIFRAYFLPSASHDKKLEALLDNSAFDYSLYQYVNPSEFWAVNAADIISKRANESWVQKAVQWLKEFAEKIKSILGLDNKHVLIAGLNNVLRGEGEFVSRKMLTENNIAFDVTKDGSNENENARPEVQQSNTNNAGAGQSAQVPATTNPAEYAVSGSGESTAAKGTGGIESNAPTGEKPVGGGVNTSPAKPNIVVKDKQGLLQFLLDDYYSVQQLVKGLAAVSPVAAKWLHEQDVLLKSQVVKGINEGKERFYEPIKNKYLELQKRFGTTKEELDSIVTAITGRNKALYYLNNNKLQEPELIQNAKDGLQAAEKIINDIKAKNPALFDVVVNELNPLMKTFTDHLVDEMLRYGRIDEATAEEFKNKFANQDTDYGLPYLPMQYGEDATAFKKEKGLSFIGDNPVERLVTNLTQITVWGENNKFRQQIYKLALALNVTNKDGKKLLVPQPKTKVIKDKDGNVFFGYGVDAPSEKMIPVWENGEVRNLEIRDEAMLDALKKQQHNPLDKERLTATQLTLLSTAEKMLRAPTRGLARAYTAYSITFAATNFFRDLSSLLAYMPKGISRSAALKSYPKAFRTALNTSSPEYKAIKDSGALVSYRDIYNLGSAKKSLTKELQGKKDVGDYIDKADDVLSYVSRVLEDTTRIAVFFAAKESGKTDREAAVAAKETTTNFERSSKASRGLGFLYLFANPSIQGGRTLVRNLRDNPNTLQVGVALGLIGFLASMFGNADRDDDGQSKYKKIPTDKRDTGVVYGGVKIPLQYGVNLPYVMGNIIGDIISEGYLRKAQSKSNLAEESKDGAVRLFNNLINVFSPIGSPKLSPIESHKIGIGEYLVRLVTPIMLQPAVDITTNRTTFGQKIAPFNNDDAFKRGVPDRYNYTRNIEPRYKDAANAAYDIAGVDVSPSTLRYLEKYLTGSAGEDLKSAIEAFTTGELKLKYEGQDRRPVLKSFTANPAPFADQTDFENASYELASILRDFKEKPTPEKREKYGALLPVAMQFAQFNAEKTKLLKGYGKAADQGYADIYAAPQKIITQRQKDLLKRYREAKNG